MSLGSFTAIEYTCGTVASISIKKISRTPFIGPFMFPPYPSSKTAYSNTKHISLAAQFQIDPIPVAGERNRAPPSRAYKMAAQGHVDSYADIDCASCRHWLGTDRDQQICLFLLRKRRNFSPSTIYPLSSMWRSERLEASGFW